jgi:RNA methyltransferase, TrmH family
MIIDSPSNPTVKALRTLEHTRSVRERGQFLVEGVRAVEEGLRAGFRPSICLYSPELLQRTERGAKLLKSLRAWGGTGEMGSAPIEATPRALQAASATLHPQGVVAAFPLIEWGAPSAQPGKVPLALISDNVQDPGNLGTLLRTAEAAGVRAVWLSPETVDQYNPKVVRAAMGAHFRLPVYSDGWQRIRYGVDTLGIAPEHVYLTDAAALLAYDAVNWTQPSALIVSNEAHGPSADAKSLAGQAISIPMAGMTESLNASIAGAVILFEAARQRRRNQI